MMTKSGETACHTLKTEVKRFWNEAACGETLYLAGTEAAAYQDQLGKRYELEPYIPEFAGFEQARGLRVLEIGVGLGADHQMFAAATGDLSGLDLTERAVAHTRRRLSALSLTSNLMVGDAEKLAFGDACFDMVYSWGVLHHSPDTARAVAEVRRVLRPGGVARIMIYHKWSFVGYMLWVRYALLRLRPWLTLEQIYARHLESPGTKAYTKSEAKRMFSGFRKVDIDVVLTHGDLLESGAGQRHRGAFLTVARRIFPRTLLRKCAPGHGLFMLIRAER